jgi:hypothetical protein
VARRAGQATAAGRNQFRLLSIVPVGGGGSGTLRAAAHIGFFAAVDRFFFAAFFFVAAFLVAFFFVAFFFFAIPRAPLLCDLFASTT